MKKFVVAACMTSVIASAPPMLVAQQCPAETRQDYCTAVGDVCFQGYLRKYVSLVAFSTVNNVTQIVGPLCPAGFTGYSNFRHLTATVTPGTRVTLTVGIDVLSRYGLLGGVRAYIDWNGNGVFESGAETIDIPLMDASKNPYVFETKVLIPRTAVEHTVMRVGFSHPGPNPPCGPFYGDCEDYSVHVLGGAKPTYQRNLAKATLQVGASSGFGYCYAGASVQTPGQVQVDIRSSLGSPLWVLALSSRLPVPSTSGGFTTMGGQFWNLDPTSMVLFPAFTSLPAMVPVPLCSPTTFSLQCIVLDSAVQDGFVLSQPVAVRAY